MLTLSGDFFQGHRDEILNLLHNKVNAEKAMHPLKRLMDIEEQAIRKALAPDAPEPANIGLSRLILQRQKDRIYTKMKYKQPPLDDSDWP